MVDETAFNVLPDNGKLVGFGRVAVMEAVNPWMEDNGGW